jgi:hypothetical protein
MRPKKVVMCDDKGCHCDGAVIGFETTSGADVIFVSAIETLRDLFKMAIDFRFGIEVLRFGWLQS